LSEPKLHKYLQKWAITRPVVLPVPVRAPFSHAIVIPAYEEAEFLPLTIQALELAPQEQLDNTLILVVVNNPPVGSSTFADDAVAQRVVTDNCRTLVWLQNHSRKTPLNLAWIDASSSGYELPAPGGVGMARKIGSDSALLAMCKSYETCGIRFDPDRTVMLHLDADTLVEESYLQVTEELLDSAAAGGVIAYKHLPAATLAGQQAIDSYELFMRYYVHGLVWAGSPYAFHCIGSTMVCTCTGYVQAGGMPAKRQAGEDFYFLQQLAKVGGVRQLRTSTVFPSSRVSDRVPFGTGPRMAEALHGGGEEFTAYDPRTFGEVKKILQAVVSTPEISVDGILSTVETVETTDFLRRKGLARALPRLQKQHRRPDQLISAFHQWFDGLATFRLIHHLTETRWPEKGLLDAWQELLQFRGEVAPTGNVSALLDWCRVEDDEALKCCSR